MKFTKDLLGCFLLFSTIVLMLTFEFIFIDFYLNESAFNDSSDPQIYWTVELNDTNDKVEKK